MHTVFAYGTLRKKEGITRPTWLSFIKDTGRQVQVQGFLYDMGWFPALRLEPDGYSVVCDVIEVDDDGLKRLDDYEGYVDSHPEASFYVRQVVNIDGLDGYIYEFGQKPPLVNLIHGPDWLEYTSGMFKARELEDA